MTNQMTVIFDAVTDNEAFARNTVAAFCVGLDPTVDQINDIKTAVSEAVTNCIVHAYPNKDKREEISISTSIDDNSVHIVISDTGIGIEDIEAAKQPFFTTKPMEERSGMGFTVMESFMDSITVERNEPSGTVIRMTKIIRGADWKEKKR
ncbi:MAG: anti-sigma F factor [Clostridiales bacterium]|nr:anti-sigma F factor [Clostridiales bacterium]